jgi:hypothetical protein
MITNDGSYSPEAYDYFWAVPEKTNATVVNQVIVPGIQETAEEFGVEVQELTWGRLPPESTKIPYVLVGPLEITQEPMTSVHNPLQSPALGYLSKLAAIPDVRLNLVAAYEAQGDRYAPLLLAGLLQRGASHWGIDIPGMDRAIGANSIYTDTLLNGTIVTNNAEDIADNIRCETFRLGYTHVRDTSCEADEALKAAQDEAGPTIQAVARKVREERLWHRAPTDGAIFVGTTEGWLASQTQSDKSVITPDQFSLIRSITPATNTIVSVGMRPPSSDAPEFLAALGVMDDGTELAVHFHSNGITRLSQDPYVAAHRTLDTIRYGRFSSTDTVVDELQRTQDGWIVLKEHGVLWTGNGEDDFTTFVDSEPIAQAHKATA